MRGSLAEYIPHPFSFGISGRKGLPIAQELRMLKQKDDIVVDRAKTVVSGITNQFPQVASSLSEVQAIQPQNIRGLYAKPAHSLLYTSPHNMRHFAATDMLSLFIGKYINATRAEKGQAPISVDALRLGAWTHDSHRSRFDMLGTIFNYQLHGIRASENLENVTRRGGLKLPDDPHIVELTREIDRYHDVDTRPFAQRSQEVEIFTTIDKLEMVRLFRPTQLRFKLPVVAQGIHLLAKKRMQAYEGATPEYMTVMGKFLPVADGLYRLTMQDIMSQRKLGKKWADINQQEAVISAAIELGIVADDGSFTTARRHIYSTTMPGPESQRAPMNRLEMLTPHTLLDSEARRVASMQAISGLKEKARQNNIPIPTRPDMDRYATTPDMFAEDYQIRVSNHNIDHHAGVAIGVVLVTTDVAANHSELLQQNGLAGATVQDILLRVAQIHDTQRINDDKESWPRVRDIFHRNPHAHVEEHGEKLAAILESNAEPKNASEKSLKGVLAGLSEDKKDLLIAVVKYHDAYMKSRVWKTGMQQLEKDEGFQGNEHTQKREQVRLLLEMFKIADGMELVRSFYAYHEQPDVSGDTASGYRPRKNKLAELYVNSRLFKQKEERPELKGIFEIYTPVIAELFQRSSRVSPLRSDLQFGYVMDRAVDMGILQAR